MQPRNDYILKAGDPEVWFNRGISCMEKGDYSEAELCFRRTQTLAPESLETLLNLGYALDMQDRFEEALRCYESILKVSPENAKARYNRAAHLLRAGNLVAGFADYEYRFSALRSADSRIYSQPRWDGSPLNGRSILVYCEQGLGDAIQFARYIPLLAMQRGRVILEVQQPLASLLALLDGVERVVVKSNSPPLTDVHIPLLSLPYIFQTQLDSIPNQVPYLTPPGNLNTIWRARVGHDTDHCRIGLAWVGKNRPNPERTCPPELITPLLAIRGASFFSLQVGEQDRFPLSQEFMSKIIDLTGDIRDFTDTAAMIANLDLVITIDTAVAHLAGALGKKVWVMLPHASDWRWMRDRHTSPWYPTMRLFRQPQTGDWASVIDAVAQKLKETLTERATMADINQESEEDQFQSALRSLAEGKHSIAINQLHAMLAQIPGDPAIWFNLGRAYDLSGQTEKAVECYLEALQARPDSPAILFCLGEIYLKQKAFTDAEAYLHKAHEQMPESIEILLALGGALVQQDDTRGAFECCKKMLTINPDSVEARYNLAYLQLRSGDYLSGFANFEARLANEKFRIDSRSYPQPRWDGAPLEGRSILVFGEQGMGDVIQFSRYLPLVAEQGGKVTLEVDPQLVPLFESFPGVTQVLSKSVTPPMTDVYIHLLSLPHLFGTAFETVPDQIPYLVPDPAKVADWQSILTGGSTCRVGLVWRGSTSNPIDRERSCPLAMFAPLAALSGVQFFSLQVGAGTDETPPVGMELVDHTARLKDMSDTAAFIANLDLVIGVDTAVIHLAGAIGKPVWVILPHIADWRWLPGSSSSPWYPTMRVFWQECQGDWASAITRVRKALEQWVGEKEGAHGFEDIEALYRLGSRLKEEGDLTGAERCFRQIIGQDPDLPDPQQSLGVVLHLQGRPQEAIEHYRTALSLDPCFVKAHYNLANSLLLSGLYEEAIVSAHATIQCDPTHADAHWLLGMLLLQCGDFRNGWQEYEWRWKAQNFKVRIPDLGRPQWDGSLLEGRSLLIHMEQGRGDMIQFIRYAPIVAATGGKVIVSAVEELRSLLESVEGVSQIVTQSGPLPDFDLHIPVLSLPHVLNTTLETIPCNVPYLRPDDKKTEEWRHIFPPNGRFRVGLAWQGSAIHRDDQNRSCALAEFILLSNLSGVDFYSLQLGKGTEQLQDLPDSMNVVDLSGRISDFSDTVAIIMHLDLVISVDTAVAHLAGALGKPVWNLLPFVPDWRWLLEREDSPWYPTMRLFRQESPGDWRNVISRVRQELSRLLADTGLLNQQGIDLMKSGCIVEAEHAFATAIAGNPGNAEAHCNRGVALDAMQRYEEAIGCYRTALSHKPDYIQPLFNMGNACLSLGNPDGARACYERVLQLMPDFVPAHLCLGEMAKGRRDYGLAHSYYRNALSVNPSCVDAFQGIAETYQAEEEFEKAIIAYRTVLTYEPGRATSWNTLGTVYHCLEKHEEAEECYRQALRLLPDRVTILNNLGVELNDQGRLDEAITVYRHLLKVDSSYAAGHWNLSVALLAAGEYLEGWREYEWRFKKINPVATRDFLQPRWDGSALQGRTILLHAEQGFGDTIQFARYVPLVARRGCRVILECQVPALKHLLYSLEGVAEVVVAGEPLPPFDCHLPMMSLPLLFGTTLDSIPAHIPYLAAKPIDIEEWKGRLGAPSAFRVGLVWFGRQSQVLNRKRSCPLKYFARLAAVPNVEFYSLQIGEGAEQIRECDSSFKVIDLTAHIGDFADTAAFITNLDLVVTIDSAVAHLAGAIGVRTWTLLPYGADWRWLHNRSDSIWYPTMRLFRQPIEGGWPALMGSVAEALESCAHGHRNVADPVSASP
ncbi:MAG TPA: tetratricopeptide repeat protein [Desulfuromonadaceae bacterium]|jgi:tetratricopeptide (TPR) repeat protein